ncbi:hypothetical protein [Aquabacter cavernae]|uniref:hypothetical protein n=1 Tax=Aquabacter cavernae TaxID=2496029 RepID=UPI000F8D94F5|nr:hypothetical protein [Aquabacter cavernae]
MRFVPAFFAALLVAMCATLPAAAATPAKPKPAKPTPDPRIWTMVKGEDTFVLRFSLQRDPDPDFAAICQPGAQLLQIAAEIDGRPFSSGEGVPVTLTAGKRRLELAATAFLGGGDGKMVVEAAVALDPRIFDLFESGDTLTLRIPPSAPKAKALVLTYPLAGARARLADFQRACLSRR